MKIELDVHKTTTTYEAATPPQGRKTVGAKRAFTYQTDKDGLTVKRRPDLWLRVLARWGVWMCI